jgi:surfactin synthase thioesterase subunit
VNRWLGRYTPLSSAAVRLVCLPHAGGGASTFVRWQGEVGELIDVVPIQLPAREERYAEPPIASVGSIAEAVAEIILDLPGGVPTFFLGHSFGAVVAYEVVRRLAAPSNGVSGLVVAAQGTPERVFELHRAHRSDAELLAGLRAHGKTPQMLLDDPELGEVLLRPLRADADALERYRPSDVSPLRVPVLAIAGRDDPLATPHELRAWRGLAGAGFDCCTVPGGHFGVHCPEGIKVVQTWVLAAVGLEGPSEEFGCHGRRTD